jgi:hypothetical protein
MKKIILKVLAGSYEISSNPHQRPLSGDFDDENAYRGDTGVLCAHHSLIVLLQKPANPYRKSLFNVENRAGNFLLKGPIIVGPSFSIGLKNLSSNIGPSIRCTSDNR